MKKRGVSRNYIFYRRVIGLPGESINYKDGKIYINGQILDKAYATGIVNWEEEDFTLEGDSYLLIGNNPNYKGVETYRVVVPQEYILGKVVFCLFPADRFGKIR